MANKKKKLKKKNNGGETFSLSQLNNMEKKSREVEKVPDFMAMQAPVPEPEPQTQISLGGGNMDFPGFDPPSSSVPKEEFPTFGTVPEAPVYADDFDPNSAAQNSLSESMNSQIPVDEKGDVIFMGWSHLPSSLMFPGQQDSIPPNFNKQAFGKRKINKPFPRIKTQYARNALKQSEQMVQMINDTVAF